MKNLSSLATSIIPWRSWLDAVLVSGLSDSHDLELRRRVAMINAGSLIAILVLVVMSTSAFGKGCTLVGIVDSFVALLLIINLGYLKSTGNYRNAAIISLIFGGLLFFYLFITGGVKGTGHLWFFTFPLVSIFLLGSRQGSIATFLLLNVALFSTLLDSSFPALYTYSGLFKIRFFFAFVVVFFYSYIFERMREVTLDDFNDVNATLKEKVEILEHTQQSLQESETTHREVVEKASDGIVVIQNFCLQFMNPQMATMLGYPADHLLATPFTDYLHPEEKEKIISRYQARISGKEIEHRYETVLKHKNGNDVAVELNVALISYHHKPATLVMIRDINQRKALEKEQLNARLAAEAANQTKSFFLANMSHELRTPLNHIIGFTELLHGEKCGSINDQQREFLSDISQSGHHLLAIVNDILDLSKIEAGKMTVERQNVDLKTMLDQTLNIIIKQADSRDITLSSTIDKEVSPLISADERKLKQVLINLLANAVKFTPDGGNITVSGHRTNMNGETTASDYHNPAAGWLELAVTDTGIGISVEDQQKVFASFQQLDNAANRKFQGTGLGLTLTKRLVELQGGHIKVESEGKGRGSRFTVTIPLSDDTGAHTSTTDTFGKPPESVNRVEDEQTTSANQ